MQSPHLVVLLVWATTTAYAYELGRVNLGTLKTTAYDCTNITSSDVFSNDVERCTEEEMNTKYKKEATVKIQLIEKIEEFPVTATFCNIRRHCKVSMCGFDGIHYGDQITQDNVLHRLDRDECFEMYRRKEYTYVSRGMEADLNKITVIPFVRNQPMKTELYTRGGRRRNGGCKAKSDDDFVSGTTGFESGASNAYSEICTFEIHIGQINGTAQARGSRRTVEFDGVRGIYGDLGLVDQVKGHLFWEKTEDANCLNTLSVIREGDAKLLTVKEDGAPSKDDLLVVKNEKERQYLGLSIKGEEEICGYKMFKTNVPSFSFIIVKEDKDGKTNMLPATFHSESYNDMNYFRATLGFIKATQDIAIAKSVQGIEMAACKMETKLIQMEMASISNGHNMAQVANVFGRGTFVQRGDDALHVFKCNEVEVELTGHPNCTLELPLKFRNQTWFRSVGSHLMKLVPEVMNCSTGAMPIHHLSNGLYVYRMGNDYHQVPKLKKLDPSLHHNISFTPSLEGLDGSYMTESQIAQVTQRLYDESARDALYMDTMNARRMNAGGQLDSFGYSSLGLADMDQLKRTLNEYFDNPLLDILGKYANYFGTCVILVSGILFAVNIVGRLLNTIMRTGTCLTWHLLAVPFESLFFFLYMRHHKRGGRRRHYEDEDIEQGMDDYQGPIYRPNKYRVQHQRTPAYLEMVDF